MKTKTKKPYKVGEHVYLNGYKGIFKITQKRAVRSGFVPMIAAQHVTEKLVMVIYETEIRCRVQQSRLEKLGLKRKKVKS